MLFRSSRHSKRGLLIVLNSNLVFLISVFPPQGSSTSKQFSGGNNENSELVEEELAVGGRRGVSKHPSWNVAHAEGYEKCRSL